jgi:iron complex outermembrane receptor protein
MNCAIAGLDTVSLCNLLGESEMSDSYWSKPPRNKSLSVGAVIRQALQFGAVAAMAAAGTAAGAADTAETEVTLQEVVVTGSYIPRTDAETASPVAIITSADIEHSGLTSVADVVRTLSADNSGSLPTAFNGAFAAGASGIALRGLTVNSTLVLIDGLRAADYALPDDGVRSFVDLNSIAIGTIERIEVLKDGASSVYGADAIGGVVNIILKKQFQGFNANAEVGNSQHGGGFEKHFDFTAGTGDLASDHWNAYISTEYQSDNAIGAWQRGYPFNSIDYVPLGGVNNNPSPDHGPGGSIYGSVTPATLGTPGNVLTGVPIPGAVSQPLQPCPATAPEITGPTGNKYCNQSFSPYQDMQPPTERVGVSTRFTVAINDTTTAYVNASYYQNESNYPSFLGPAQIQTTAPNITTNIALPATIPGPGGIGTQLNPNNPFAALGEAALINYAFGDLGSNINYVKNHNFRLVGDIAGTWMGWGYDGSFVINRTWLDYEQSGLLNFTALVNAVTNGTYNFINPASNSSAVRAALSPRLIQNDSSDMNTVVFRINRSLFDLPGGPLGFAAGTEWRYEAEYDGNFNSPPPEVQNLGFSQAIGSRNIASVYAEFDAPVVKMLDLTASGRFDHYSDFGNASTPKFGFVFKPLQQASLRGTFSKGFRAPSFAENGSSEVEGFVNYSACPSNLCTAHGADGYINSYSLGELTIGNPNIRPETSTSYTLGLVLEPIKNYSATVDYYYIKKNGLIAGPNLGGALGQYNTNGTLPAGFTAVYDNLDPAFPGALPRIVTITGPYSNGASEYTDGVDIDLTAKVNLGPFGKLISDLSATRILSFVYEGIGQPRLQYVDTQSPYNLSSGAGTPQDRATWTNSWTNGPLTFSVIAYYTGGYHEYGSDVAPQYLCLGPAITGVGMTSNCRVGSFTDIDVTGSFEITKNFSVSAMIQNVADKLPPVDTPNYAGINYNPTYSQAGYIGRFFRVGVHYKM